MLDGDSSLSREYTLLSQICNNIGSGSSRPNTPRLNNANADDFGYEQTKRFIEWVGRNPLLWDKTCPEFRKRGKQGIFIMAEAELGFGDKTGKSARKLWMNLFCRFHRQTDRLNKGGNVIFPFYDQMKQFVPPLNIKGASVAEEDEDDDIRILDDTYSIGSTDLIPPHQSHMDLANDTAVKKEVEEVDTRSGCAASQSSISSNSGIDRKLKDASVETLPYRKREASSTSSVGIPSRCSTPIASSVHLDEVPSVPPTGTGPTEDVGKSPPTDAPPVTVKSNPESAPPEHSAPPPKSRRLSSPSFIPSPEYSGFFSYIQSEMDQMSSYPQKLELQTAICHCITEVTAKRKQ